MLMAAKLIGAGYVRIARVGAAQIVELIFAALIKVTFCNLSVRYIF